MTQNPTPAERAERVVFRHRGRDYPMSGAGYGRLLDRVAAKLKGDTKVSAAEESLMAKAGWAPPGVTGATERRNLPANGETRTVPQPAAKATAPLTPEQALVARAGWAD